VRLFSRLICISLFFFTLQSLPAEKSFEDDFFGIVLYHSLIKTHPSESQYYYDLGYVYYTSQYWDQAINSLEQAIRLQTDNTDAKVVLAYAYLNRYRSKSYITRSENLFNQVLKEAPTYTDAKEGLKKIQSPPSSSRENEKFVFDNFDEIVLFENLLSRDPMNSSYYYSLGRAYYKIGAFNQSIQAFNHALAMEPQNNDIKLGLAYALLNQYIFRDDLNESRRLFQQTLAIFPGYTDAKEGLNKIESILSKPPLSQKYSFVSDKSHEDFFSIILYGSLAQAYPNDPHYSYELGLSYYHLHSWDPAIEALEHVIEFYPHPVNAEMILAQAYYNRYTSKQDLLKSKRLFEEILKNHPDYKDAENGLKRLHANQISSRDNEKFKYDNLDEILLFQNLSKYHSEQGVYYYSLGRAFSSIGVYPLAIAAFNHALELEPDNSDVKLGLAYALLNQYDFQDDLFKSRWLFSRYLALYPDDVKAKQSLKMIDKMLITSRLKKKKEPTLQQKWAQELSKIAQNLSKQGDHWESINIYLQLVEEFPDNPEFLFLLGREYVQVNARCEAISLFRESLLRKPDYIDSIVVLGNQYLYFKDFCKSLALFSRAVELSSKDTSAWVGLARTESALDQPDLAETHYLRALALEPKNPDVVQPYASFLIGQRRYLEGESAFQNLADLQNDYKTYRYSLFDISSYTTPGVYLTGGSTEEREKDLFTHQWVASLRYMNAEGGLYFPLNDRLRLSARGRWLDVRQRNLVAKIVTFETRFEGGGVRAEWFYNPYWTVTLNANVNWVSNAHARVSLPTKRGVKFEPSLVFRYVKDPDMISFGEITDSWIFKNFKKLHVTAFTRESLFMTYQRDFGDQILAGTDAAWLWYQDPIQNQEQILNAWAQVGIPYFEENLSLRYHSEYLQFKEETNGYYSFEYQWTHWLKLRFYKAWLFGGRIEALYWHGWRTVRGKNPQEQITTGPLTTLIPVTTIENQIDAVYLTLGYNPTTHFDIWFSGSYWHDSYDYTVVSGKFWVECRF